MVSKSQKGHYLHFENLFSFDGSLTSQSDLLSNRPASKVARNSGYRTLPYLSNGTRLSILSNSFFSISSPNLDSSNA